MTDTEIVVGSCAALEGPAKFLGTQTVMGAKAYLNEVNERGGIHGRKLRLVSYDDGYEPERAAECFNRLRKDGVFAAAFFVGTPTAAKYVPLMEAEKLPLVVHTGDSRDVADAIEAGASGIEHGSMRDRIPDELFARIVAARRSPVARIRRHRGQAS